MSTRLRERRAFATPGRTLASDRAVSPVVGMIMVLAISVVGIASILYWGLPAIDEMKANVEFRSAETQFHELDATVRELVAGTTEKTAKRWSPSLNRGQVSAQNNTEPWLFAVENYNTVQDYDFVWGGMVDGDNSFLLRSNVATPSLMIEAEIVTSTTSGTSLNVSSSAASDDQMGSENLFAAPGEVPLYVYVKSNSAQQPLQGGTFRFKVWEGSTLVAEAWYFKTGRVDFSLDAGVGNKEVITNNGAVITGNSGSYAIVNSPPLPPPTESGGIHRLFARSILMGGDASAAGEDTFSMLLTLYATATLAGYDCAKADRSDCVVSVKYFNYGTYQAPWYAYLTSPGRGYDYVERTSTLGGASVKYLEDQETYMGFTLLQSSVKLTGG